MAKKNEEIHKRDTKYYTEYICHQFPDLHNQISGEFQLQKQPTVTFFKQNFLKKFAVFTGNISVGISF